MRSSERLHYLNLSQRTLDYLTLLLFEKLLLRSWMWEKRRGGGGWQGNFGRTTNLKGGGALAAEGSATGHFRSNGRESLAAWGQLEGITLGSCRGLWWREERHQSTTIHTHEGNMKICMLQTFCLFEMLHFSLACSVFREVCTHTLLLFELVVVVLGKIPLKVNQILDWTFKSYQLLSDHPILSVSFNDKTLTFGIFRSLL